MPSAFLILCLISSMADGQAAAARGDYAAAAQFYRAEMDSNPQAFEPKFQLARMLSFSGKRDEAIRLYSDLLEASPENSDVLLARGRVYAWNKQYAESEQDLLAVTTKSLGYADAWLALGDMYYWSGNYDKALEAYGTLISLKPDDPAGYISRGKVQRAKNETALARTDFEAARTHGADVDEVDVYIASLEKRRLTPEAQVPEGFHWSTSSSYSVSSFSPTRADWTELTTSVRRHFSRGSLAAEFLRADRFDKFDEAYALDGYIDLWNRSYANVRYQHSPNADLYPDASYRVEIFQGFGKGWELAGSYDYLRFGNSNTDLYGVGLGKYIGNWYLRSRTVFIPSTPTLGFSERMLARYYFAGNADDYVELNGGWSHGGQFIRSTTAVEKTRGHSFGGVLAKHFGKNWGLKFSGSYGDDENSFVERSFSVGVQTRW